MLGFFLFKHKEIDKPKLVRTYGAFYDGLKTSRLIYLMCNFYFTSRRFLLVTTIVLFNKHPALQVMLFIFLSKLNIIYIIQFRPFIDSTTNLVEIFNECCILLSSYPLFVFTDYVSDKQVREIAGYLMIGIILLNFLVNLLIQGIIGLHQLKVVLQRLRNRLCPPRRVPVENGEVLQKAEAEGKSEAPFDNPFAYHCDKDLKLVAQQEKEKYHEEMFESSGDQEKIKA